MSSTGSSQSSTHRSRRRLAVWVAFGVAGLASGAVWAFGFATVSGATGANAASPIITPSTPDVHTPDLAGLVAAGSPLTVNWAGRWGAVADTNFFTVDLSAQSSTRTYDVAVLVTNATAFSDQGWTSLQLKLEEVDAGAGPCVASAFDGNQHPRVMALDSEDAGVYWNSLPGGDVYCFGLHAGDGQDTAGTFLRRASDTVDPAVYPQFLATVDRRS
jgi:hypothetical protein